MQSGTQGCDHMHQTSSFFSKSFGEITLLGRHLLTPNSKVVISDVSPLLRCKAAINLSGLKNYCVGQRNKDQSIFAL